MSRQLNQVVDLSVIDEVQAAADSELREARLRVKLLTERLEASKDKRQELKWAEDAASDFSALEGWSAKVERQEMAVEAKRIRCRVLQNTRDDARKLAWVRQSSEDFQALTGKFNALSLRRAGAIKLAARAVSVQNAARDRLLAADAAVAGRRAIAARGPGSAVSRTGRADADYAREDRGVRIECRNIQAERSRNQKGNQQSQRREVPGMRQSIGQQLDEQITDPQHVFIHTGTDYVRHSSDVNPDFPDSAPRKGHKIRFTRMAAESFIEGYPGARMVEAI